MTVHVLYENESWLPPLTEALAARGLEVRTHFVDGGAIDLGEEPPEGVWVNRMSPSAHTRGHQGGVAYTREILGVLEAAGRRVINGSAAFALEVSKLRQDATLRAAGIATPRTVGVVGREGLAEAARRLGAPFLTKHNQGGKGLGVQLFRDLRAFDAWLATDDAEPSPDGITVLQRYVEPPEPFVTRVEIVGARFLYAIRSSTAEGFELCPSDACQVSEAAFCPVGGTGRFALRPEITADDPLVRRYVAYCERHGLDVAGIEFVEDADGERYTYDVNANSNYNSGVEREHGLDGMGAIADLCARELGLSLAAK
jgi:glutathione synthase/RimK-type ligase-like ATP-grasp enzyme